MLTKDDLEQIGILLDQKLEEKLEQKLEEKLEQKFEQKLNPITKDIKSMKKDIRYLKKTVDLIAKNYDEGDVKLGRSVTKIEHHLGLSDGN